MRPALYARYLCASSTRDTPVVDARGPPASFPGSRARPIVTWQGVVGSRHFWGQVLGTESSVVLLQPGVVVCCRGARPGWHFFPAEVLGLRLFAPGKPANRCFTNRRQGWRKLRSDCVPAGSDDGDIRHIGVAPGVRSAVSLAFLFLFAFTTLAFTTDPSGRLETACPRI